MFLRPVITLEPNKSEISAISKTVSYSYLKGRFYTSIYFKQGQAGLKSTILLQLPRITGVYYHNQLQDFTLKYTT